MATDSPSPLDSEWLEALYARSPDELTSLLQSTDLSTEAGLSRLLDEAMRLARSDPGKARQLTLICADAARQAGLPGVLPRATYIRAQTHAVNGEFTAALELIAAARAEWETIGETIEALRTNLGLMHVFNELGRHREALQAGQAILEAFSGQEEPPPQARAMLAIAHSNLGACYETMGRYEDALDAYNRAEARLAELGMNDYLADVSNNRGIVLMYLGRVSEALSAFEKASRITVEAGLTLLQAQVLNNLGEAHLIQGSYALSLQAFEQARQLFEKLDARANLGILLHKMADAYLALNLYPEAVDLYWQAGEVTGQAGMADHHARTLLGLGAALVAQDRLEEAAQPLEAAAGLFEQAGHLPLLSSALLEKSALKRASGDLEGALRTARRALELVDGETWPVQRLYAHLRLSDLLLPDVQAAEAELQQARRWAALLDLPVINYRLHSRLGRACLLSGREDEAQAYLETAIAEIEKLRGDLPQEAGRVYFLHDKLSPYEDLLQLFLNRGDSHSVRRAFAVAEAAKSRALLDLLTGVVRPGPAAAGDPELAGQLAALRADLNAAYNQVLEPSGEWEESRLAELRARIAGLEGEINRLRLREASTASPPDPFEQPFSPETLFAKLPAGHTLLAYTICGDEILAFLVRGAEIDLVRRVGRASVVKDLLARLNAQWDRFRAGEDFTSRNMPLLLKSTQRILSALYGQLFPPLSSRLKEATAAGEGSAPGLVIVPHGILHQVPFHALYDGQKYLIDDFEISYALSSAVFALCQARPRPPASRALVMGLSDELIPEAAGEARAVADAISASGLQVELSTGPEAGQAAFWEAAPGVGLLHLACHGLFRAGNPMFSALKFSDGWLTAADVLQHALLPRAGLQQRASPAPLPSSLVVLSACESGRGLALTGDEVIGLPRAFLGAGAASVLVSLWVVPDRATAGFMQRWYGQLLDGVGRAAALRRAQLAHREQHPHPYFWAPFVLIGQI